MKFVYLSIAIISEVVATSALKASNGFTRLLPSLVVVAGYGAAFYFLSICLDKISVGVAYAIWSGLGIVLVTIAAAVVYKEIPDGAAILGMVLIVWGVLVLNLWSKTASH
jgi:small multidrug resistance pump